VDAKAKALNGDDRKAFMSECLKGDKSPELRANSDSNGYGAEPVTLPRRPEPGVWVTA